MSLYIYSVSLLKELATQYHHLYQAIECDRHGFYHHTITNPWLIAEFKSDFDTALDAIGRGHWIGELESTRFSDYKSFGRLQRIVIAGILGIEDWELAGMGFYDIPRLKGFAYYSMKKYLKGE